MNRRGEKRVGAKSPLFTKITKESPYTRLVQDAYRTRKKAYTRLVLDTYRGLV